VSDITTAWNLWWEQSEWFMQSSTGRPKWNSAARTGQIWTLFGEAVLYPTGRPHVFCLRCGCALQHPSIGPIGTKHLSNHADTRMCKSIPIPIHTQSPITYRPFHRAQDTLSLTRPFSNIAFEEEIVRVIIDSNWSFRTVERSSFQRFIQFLRPETVITTRYKFRTIFHEQSNQAKHAILSGLNNTTKISLALDAWTANNHLCFLAVKAYFINDKWQLKERLLDFIPVRGSHTGEAMARALNDLLTFTGTKDRLLAITCDNAGNNGTLASHLEETLENDGIVWSAKENIIPCVAHIINLVVQDIILHLKLAASEQMENGRRLERRHIAEIDDTASVPNSLRKVISFITVFYHILTSN
jgi:hypothetical protein